MAIMYMSHTARDRWIARHIRRVLFIPNKVLEHIGNPPRVKVEAIQDKEYYRLPALLLGPAGEKDGPKDGVYKLSRYSGGATISFANMLKHLRLDRDGHTPLYVRPYDDSTVIVTKHKYGHTEEKQLLSELSSSPQDIADLYPGAEEHGEMYVYMKEHTKDVVYMSMAAQIALGRDVRYITLSWEPSTREVIITPVKQYEPGALRLGPRSPSSRPRDMFSWRGFAKWADIENVKWDKLPVIVRNGLLIFRIPESPENENASVAQR